jgi:hypothetical protein
VSDKPAIMSREDVLSLKLAQAEVMLAEERRARMSDRLAVIQADLAARYQITDADTIKDDGTIVRAGDK